MSGRNTDVRRVLPIRTWVWRFCTGAHMDGYRRTNATFWYKGNRHLSGIVKASKWAYRPGYQRMLIRWAACWATLFVFVALIFFRTFLYLSILVLLGYLIYRKMRRPR